MIPAKKFTDSMRKEMADILRSVNDDVTEIKTSVTQTETKLETAIEAKLVDSVGKEVSK